MDEQKNYFYADEEFYQAFVDEIAKKIGDMFSKKSDTEDLQTLINSKIHDWVPITYPSEKDMNDFPAGTTYLVWYADSGEQQLCHTPWNEKSDILYIVCTFGTTSSESQRGCQLAFAPYNTHRKSWVRYMHNNVWSNWEELITSATYQIKTQTVILTNDQEYPFNNSQDTVSLTTARQNTNYEVDTEIMSPANGEQVGRIIITDKLTNGFKISYTGSAKSVTLKCTIKGGMS